MTGSDDLLERAARALREAHPGHHPGSGFTRARIMSSLHQGRRRRVLRWAILSPLVSLLIVGSAWAQSSGKWPALWRAVTSVFVSAPPPAAPPRPSSARSAEPPAPRVEAAEPSAAEATELEAGGAEPAEGEPSEPEPRELDSLDADPSQSGEPAAPPRPLQTAPQRPPPSTTRERQPPRPSARARPAPARRKPAGAAPRGEAERGPETPPEPEPAPDPELALFRAAHDLHFAGRPREAIAAYAEYLRRYPRGRFVPEARYNGALDHIKLGDTAAARAALEPFAAGEYGGYRQKEARRLLNALR